MDEHNIRYKSENDWQYMAEAKLWQLAEGVEVMSEKVDKDGCVHELRAKMPPNMEAVKFILKNKSKGKWADKTEITNTQINFNLTASYDEVTKILAQQQEQARLEAKPLIEAEVLKELEEELDG